MATIQAYQIWLGRGLALFAVVFGLLTLKEGGAVLFGGEAVRAAAGNYVPFVLWFNFIAGFFYIAAGAGLWIMQRWALWLAAVIALATLLVFAVLGVHIYAGGAYETRTLVAMSARSGIWLLISGYAFKLMRGF